MKRVLLFIVPLVIAFAAFFGILFFMDTRSGKGALQVTSVPKSKVYVDGRLVGTTPVCLCDSAQMLDVKEYTVKLAPEDSRFKPFENKIDINKSTLTAVDRTFDERAESDGSIISLSPLGSKEDIEILVVSFPDKANVFLDNNAVGITPLHLKNISQSDHDLKIIKKGYKDKAVKVKTTSGFKLTSIAFLGIDPGFSKPKEASPSASAAEEPEKVLIQDTPTGFLRVREESSISSLEITQVSPGEEYELLSEEEGWFEIKIVSEEQEDVTGWISSSYAEKRD
jgi:hypothetical protein